MVKKIRQLFLSKFSSPPCNYNIYDNEDLSILSHNYIKYNIDTLENMLSTKKIENETMKPVSKKILKMAADTFTFMNFCPNKINRFLKNLLESESPENILLSLISIMKSSQNAEKQSSFKVVKSF